MLQSLLLALAPQVCPLPIDVNPVTVGNPSFFVSPEFVTLGSEHYFAAHTVANGIELYKTDGTTVGTTLVADIDPGPNDSMPQELTVGPGGVYFTAFVFGQGRELWRTDGTAAGTQVVVEIQPGSGNSAVNQVEALPGLVLFSASDPVVGRELFVTDGTVAGTQLLGDLAPGATGSFPSDVTAIPGGTRAVFFADGPGGVEALYSTDGTPGGLTQLAVLSPAQFGTGGPFMPLGGELVFLGDAAGTLGLWRTDGTVAGTQLIPAPPMYIYTEDHAELGGELYFFANDFVSGNELWKTDGTGAQLVQDTAVGSVSSQRGPLAVHAGEVFWVQRFHNVVWRVMASQGTPATTRVVDTLTIPAPGGIADLASDGTHLVLTAPSDIGAEPRILNPGGVGVSLLADLNPGVDSSMTVESLYPLPGGGFLFAADQPGIGRELHRTDGTTAGTVLLADIDPGMIIYDSQPFRLAAVGGDALMFAGKSSSSLPAEIFELDADGTLGELMSGVVPTFGQGPRFVSYWDGTQANVAFNMVPTGFGADELAILDGAGAVHTVGNVRLDPDTFEAAAVGERLVFVAEKPFTTDDIYVTDGTAAGTMVLPVNTTTTTGTVPRNLTVFGDRVLFSATTPTHGRELFITDGTAAGTQLLADINPTGDSHPAHLTRVGDRVMFFASQVGAAGPFDLWTTDGTPAGTQLVASVPATLSTSATDELAVLDGVAYFALNVAGFGSELWRTDLTAAGTYQVIDLRPGANGSVPSELTAANGRVFFEANAGTGLGRELYATDGTAAGTLLVADLVPGAGSSDLRDLVAVGSGLYFVGPMDVATGAEVYFTDGTTVMPLCDLAPGQDPSNPGPPASSNPRELTLARGSLYLAAEDPNGVGDELWELPVPGAHVLDLGFTSGSLVVESDAPVLGQSVSVRGWNAPAGDASVLALSAPLSSPTTNPLLGSAALWLDLGTFQLLKVALTPNWTYPQTLPLDAALVGAAFNVQAFTVDATTLTDWKASNGLRLFLGS